MTQQFSTMVSYHGDPAIKQKYVDRFAKHRAADEVIQGTGFDNGRGCFVGCTLDKYDHSRFPAELGWPEWLARLADKIFEGLPKSEAPQFGTDLLDTVPVGIDLEPVRHMANIRRMDRLILLMKENKSKSRDIVIESLEMVKRASESELRKDHCDWSAVREKAWKNRKAADAAYAAAAADAAYAAAAYAAYAAYATAYAAAYAAADAYAAAYAADAAAYAAADAYADAYAAAYAADAAAYARHNAYRKERDDLLDILRSMSK